MQESHDQMSAHVERIPKGESTTTVSRKRYQKLKEYRTESASDLFQGEKGTGKKVEVRSLKTKLRRRKGRMGNRKASVTVCCDDQSTRKESEFGIRHDSRIGQLPKEKQKERKKGRHPIFGEGFRKK